MLNGCNGAEDRLDTADLVADNPVVLPFSGVRRTLLRVANGFSSLCTTAPCFTSTASGTFIILGGVKEENGKKHAIHEIMA